MDCVGRGWAKPLPAAYNREEPPCGLALKQGHPFSFQPEDLYQSLLASINHLYLQVVLIFSPPLTPLNLGLPGGSHFLPVSG